MLMTNYERIINRNGDEVIGLHFCYDFFLHYQNISAIVKRDPVSGEMFGRASNLSKNVLALKTKF